MRKNAKHLRLDIRKRANSSSDISNNSRDNSNKHVQTNKKKKNIKAMETANMVAKPVFIS